MRGLAKIRIDNREVLRSRFHRSLELWLRNNSLPKLPTNTKLISIVDGIWFRLGKRKIKYCCYIILLRPINKDEAVVAVVNLRKGRESVWEWEKVFKKIPIAVRRNIVALTSDKWQGIESFYRKRGWHLQLCHTHIKRKVFELRGFRKVPARDLRQEATKTVYRFLETSSDVKADVYQDKLKRIFAHPVCPKSFPSRLSALVRKGHYFRTYRKVPELNLPVTTNCVEQINDQIKNVLSNTRGMPTIKSLKLWLDILHRKNKRVKCRGYQETLMSRSKKIKRQNKPKSHRISLS